MCLAALDLLAKHAGQFDQYIYDEYSDIFERISNWTRHKNYDMKKLAYVALDAFYREVFTNSDFCHCFVVNSVDDVS